MSIKPSERIAELMDSLRVVKSSRVPKGDEMHITLAFLGDISDSERTEFCSLISKISYDSFTIRTTGIGAFPDATRANVAYIGVNSPELVGLQAALFAKIPEKFRDKREFVPHLTVARFKVRTDMRALFNLDGPEDYGEYPVGKLTLYSSNLTPDGAIYTEECSVQLM